MMKDEIKLTARNEWFPGHRPRNAVRGSVARIIGCVRRRVKPRKKFMGRHVGGRHRPFVYKLMVMGDTVTLRRGSDGLYEVTTGRKDGGCYREMYVVLWHPGHGMIIGPCARGEAAKIARRLEDGDPIEAIVEVSNLRPSVDGEAMTFDPVYRPKS